MVSVMNGSYRHDLWGFCFARKRAAVIYPNLPAVYKDEEVAIRAMKFIGCDQWYILNDKESNITTEKLRETLKPLEK